MIPNLRRFHGALYGNGATVLASVFPRVFHLNDFSHRGSAEWNGLRPQSVPYVHESARVLDGFPEWAYQQLGWRGAHNLTGQGLYGEDVSRPGVWSFAEAPLPLS